MFTVVALGSYYQSRVVPGILERCRQLISAIDIHVLSAILKKNTQGLRLHFPHERGIDMIAAQISETADEAENTVERVRSAPGGIERPEPY